MKSYKELISLPTFEERFNYLACNGTVADLTFGSSRYLNQIFYSSKEWLSVRDEVIVRDLGKDLGIEDRDIMGQIYIHHINPITVDMVVNRDPLCLDPNNLICCSFNTHQAIHYGDESKLIPTKPIERKPNDTCPWRQ